MLDIIAPDDPGGDTVDSSEGLGSSEGTADCCGQGALRCTAGTVQRARC